MATGEIHVMTIPVGAISNETVPIFKTPTASQGGGITILSASAIQGGTPDSSLRLVTMGTAGTSVSGTLTTTAVGGTASQFVNNVAKSWTLSTAYVDPNTWVGVKEGNVEAASADLRVTLNYLMGKTA